MRTIRRLIILLAFVATLVAASAATTPAQATCQPGEFSVKPLVIRFPQCYPPGGGPV